MTDGDDDRPSSGPSGSPRATDEGRAAVAEDLSARGGSTEAVQSFYGHWARLYDVLARFTPGIGRLRRESVAALGLDTGDVVVDLGCGTGANLPYLRAAVGASGTVVGVDLTGGMLDRGRTLVAASDWENVHVVQGDARTPPIGGRVDGVLASFVVGMLDDPGRAVHDWCDLVAGTARPGDPQDGTVVLVDAALSDRRVAAPLNGAFRALTVLSTPPTMQFRYDPSPHDVLRERVTSARETLDARASATVHHEHLLGIVRVSGGQVDGCEETDDGIH